MAKIVHDSKHYRIEEHQGLPFKFSIDRKEKRPDGNICLVNVGWADEIGKANRRKNEDFMNQRNKRLFEQAVVGLQEYHVCLNDGALVLELLSVVKFPDTGNDQADYENIRDQVEKFANQNNAHYGE